LSLHDALPILPVAPSTLSDQAGQRAEAYSEGAKVDSPPNHADCQSDWVGVGIRGRDRDSNSRQDKPTGDHSNRDGISPSAANEIGPSLVHVGGNNAFAFATAINCPRPGVCFSIRQR